LTGAAGARTLRLMGISRTVTVPMAALATTAALLAPGAAASQLSAGGGGAQLSVSSTFIPYDEYGIATGRLPGSKRHACVQWKHQQYIGWNTVGCGQTKQDGSFRIRFTELFDYDLVGAKVRVLARAVKKRKLKTAVTPSVVVTFGGELGPKQETPPPTAPGNPAYEDQVVALVNAERAKAGCDAVTNNEILRTSARNHSADMAVNGYFDHASQDGRSPGDRIRAAGYQWSAYGENIAYGSTTPADVMAQWMASSGHRSNILNCGFEDLGVGLAYTASNVPYWTQNFGSR